MASTPQSDKHLSRVLTILQDALAGLDYRLYLFGSRATGRYRPSSDYDIAVEAHVDVARRLSHAREALEESTIPLQVDLVDMADASLALRQQVQREGVEIWSGSASA